MLLLVIVVVIGVYLWYVWPESGRGPLNEDRREDFEATPSCCRQSGMIGKPLIYEDDRFLS